MDSSFIPLLNALTKARQTLGAHDKEGVVYVFDSFNTLFSSTGGSELEMLEFLNSLVDLRETDGNIGGLGTLILSISRDLFLENAEKEVFESWKADHADVIFEVRRNLTGYSKDVHGQLFFSERNIIKDANLKFKKLVNKVDFFEQYVL